MVTSLLRSIVMVGLVLALSATGHAKADFGPQVDTFCSSFAGVTPYADLNDGMLGECTLCHSSTFPSNLPDGGNVISSAKTLWNAGKNNGDFSGFCPVANNTAPVLAAIGPQVVNVGMPLTINVSASDPENDGIAIAVANAPVGHVFSDNGNGTATFTWTPAQAGSVQVTFSATDDGVPMMSAMEVVTITVGQGNQPPTIDPIADQSVAVAAALSVAIMASDPDQDAIALGLMNPPAGAIVVDNGDGTGSVEWTPGSAGNFGITVTASDDGTPPQSASESFMVSVGNVNRPPVLTPIGDRSVEVGNMAQVLITASDADNDALQVTVAGEPGDATFTDFGDGTAELLWTPLAPGSYQVTISVTDSGSPAETVSETFALSATDPVVIGDLVLTDAFWTFQRPGDDSDDSDDSDSDDSDSDSDSDDADDSDSDDSDPSHGSNGGSSYAGTLTVSGTGASAAQQISVFDADSGALLGAGMSDEQGGFTIMLMSRSAPCSVQVGVDAPTSLPMTVQNAPAQCGVAAPSTTITTATTATTAVGVSKKVVEKKKKRGKKKKSKKRKGKKKKKNKKGKKRR